MLTFAAEAEVVHTVASPPVSVFHCTSIFMQLHEILILFFYLFISLKTVL